MRLVVLFPSHDQIGEYIKQLKNGTTTLLTALNIIIIVLDYKIGIITGIATFIYYYPLYKLYKKRKKEWEL